MRKRKVTYPVARTATKQPRSAGLPGDPNYVRSTVATINLAALDVRDDLKVGHRVKIGGGGLYAGEFAIVESILSGIIPAAMVRTEAGKTRRVRSVDLERVAAEKPATPVVAQIPAPEAAVFAPEVLAPAVAPTTPAADVVPTPSVPVAAAAPVAAAPVASTSAVPVRKPAASATSSPAVRRPTAVRAKG